MFSYAYDSGFRTVISLIRLKESSKTKDFIFRLSVVHSYLDNHQEALSLRERAASVYVDQLDEHPFTGTLYNYLGNDCLALGNFEKAVEYFSKARSIRENVLGSCHQETARTLHDLGVAYKMKVSIFF